MAEADLSVINKPHGYQNEKLELSDIIAILEEAKENPSRISPYPPIKPNGGTIFLVNRGDEKKNQRKYFISFFTLPYNCYIRTFF